MDASCPAAPGKKNQPMTNYTLEAAQQASLRADVTKRSDRLMNYFMAGFFITGLAFAPFYETWSIAIGIGGLLLLAYYSTKILLPASNLYQYVLSVVLALFMAQYIYQMHGLFEMHFFAFIGSALLIMYQNWKLQLPMAIVVVMHHAVFGYLQDIGFDNIYFTRLDYFDLQTFIIHIVLAAIIFFICGLWAYQLKKNSELQVGQALEMSRLQKEAQLHEERKRHAEALERSNWELMKSNEQLEKARFDAEQANRAKSIFLATMSHEIRTPMNGVIGMASLLAETSQTEQQRMYTETIATCGESLLHVINDILDFSKIESGSMELERHEFNLRDSVENILDIFGQRAAKTGLELIYQIDEAVPVQIVGDDLRLRQVLTNLVSNAIKFTREGEIFVSIHLLNTAADGTLELQFKVRDSGIGIPENKLHRLFKAFSQVDSSTTRQYGGTGLGLAISEKLVKLMDGGMAVESKTGQGSVFSFTIKSTAGSTVLLPAKHDNLVEVEGKKVLIVDDNLTNRTILKNQLQLWKLQPVLAASAPEALDLLLHDTSFDLVLTDMQMPDIDGISLANTIRNKYPHIPIILLSSMGDECAKGNRQLFNAVLTKPIKQHVLRKHIEGALQQREKPVAEEKTSQQKLSVQFAEKYPLQILVAEDNLINQQVIGHILSRLGYQADIAENGVETITMAKEKDYEVILMDMQMPEMDGLEATKIIRDSFSKQPIIIALTANTMQGDEDLCLQAGMNDYIGKPVDLDELLLKLEKWANLSQESIVNSRESRA
jgi:two-component system, sensor histidine kinase and response regulator